MDETAVVIGATHGIGLGVVEALVERGVKVIGTGRRAPDVTVTGAHFAACDITRAADLAGLAATARDRLGEIDLLHVNAGVAELEPFDAVTEASFDRTFAVNARGAFFAVQRLTPLLRPGGSVVFTSSVADVGGSPGMLVYGASKAALRSIAAGLAAELLPRRIRVNVVSPGFIDTPTAGVAGYDAAARTEFAAIGDSATPMRRHGSVAEVAQAVLFLAFDATFTTGARLPVDGGLGEQLEHPEPAAA